jgi:hypothetical protein
VRFECCLNGAEGPNRSSVRCPSSTWPSLLFILLFFAADFTRHRLGGTRAVPAPIRGSMVTSIGKVALDDSIFGGSKKMGHWFVRLGQVFSPSRRLDSSAGIRGHRQNLGRSLARVLARPQTVRPLHLMESLLYTPSALQNGPLVPDLRGSLALLRPPSGLLK